MGRLVSRREKRQRRRSLSRRSRNQNPAELLEPRILLIGDPIDLQQSPIGLGHYLGTVTSDLDTSSDVDHWEFEALAGDQILFGVDTPNSGLNPTVSLRNTSDGNLGTDNDAGPGLDALFGPFTITTTGTYSARVAGQGNTLGEYDLRVQLVRDGVQLERDANHQNGVVQTATPLRLGLSGNDATALVAGNVSAADGDTADIDSFLIGRMNAGVVVDLSVVKPLSSTLNGEVRLVDSLGNLVADSDGAIDESGSYATPAAGDYFGQVSATSGAGSNATYVLTVAVDDDVPPEVVAVNALPANGESGLFLSNSFSVEFDESLLGSSLTTGAVSLVAAGADSQFDTVDDFQYNIVNVPAFVAGSIVSFAVDGGQAVPGEHRLRLSSTITDAVGNALDGNADGVGGDDYDQFFTVTLPEGSHYHFEQLANATRDLATPLPLDQDPAQSELRRAIGFGAQQVAANNVWADEDWWSFEGEAGDALTLAVDSFGSGINGYVELYNAAGGFLTSDDNGGVNQDAVISGYRLPADGIYFARIGNWNANTGRYQIRVDMARGITAETDVQYNNDPLAGADVLNPVDVGEGVRSVSVAGYVQATEGNNQDEDSFDIGILNAGDSVDLSLRLPTGSTLSPRLQLYSPTGKLIAETTDAQLMFEIAESDRYLVRVSAVEGAGPDARYVLDVVDQRFALAPRVTSVSRLSLPGPSQTEYENKTLAASPSVYWKLNETEGSTVADASGNAPVNGTLIGDATFGGKSVFGNATDQSIGIGGEVHFEIPDSERVEAARAMSFSFWLKPDTFANTWMPLVFKGTTNSNQRGYALWLQSNGNLQLDSSRLLGDVKVWAAVRVRSKRDVGSTLQRSIDRDQGCDAVVDERRAPGQSSDPHERHPPE